MSAASTGGFNCPHCGQHYSLTPEQVPQYEGQTIACTVCQKQFTVPGQLAPSIAQPAARAYAAQPAAQSYPQYPPAAPYPPVPPYPQQGYPPGGPAVPMAHYAAPRGYDMGPMVGPRTSGLAIASLVCGLLFFIPLLPGLLGVIFGIVALRQTKDQMMTGRGLAIAGSICGGLSLLLWGTCFMGPLVGMNRGFQTARRNAQQVKCASNLRQIGMGIMLYANDHGGQYPRKLSELIEHADLPPDALVCPHTTDTPAPGADVKTQAANVEKGGHLSYVYVGQNLNSNSPPNAVLAYEKLGNHGNQGTNVLFNDGHTEWYDATATATLMSELNAGNNPPRVK